MVLSQTAKLFRISWTVKFSHMQRFMDTMHEIIENIRFFRKGVFRFKDRMRDSEGSVAWF